jgi:hypothetical protein
LPEEPKPSSISQIESPARGLKQIFAEFINFYFIRKLLLELHNVAPLKIPDPEDVERRRVQLRAQRDKILSQKRKERELQLEQQERSDIEEGESKVGMSRPRSGRAARAALAGEASPEVDERTIQYRRLLLQKIKEEVEGVQTK